MIRAKLLLCAEGIVIDRRTNNVSAFEILEQLNPPTLPIVHPKMVVLSVLESDEDNTGKVPVNIRITVAGSEVLNQVVKHDFQGRKRSRNMFGIAGLPIAQSGILEISLLKDGNKLASYTIEVTAPEQAIVQKPSAKNKTAKKTKVEK